MELYTEDTKLIPVSKEFKNTIHTLFPPFNIRDVNNNTTMVDIQRHKERQLILDYIDKCAVIDATYRPKTFMDRIMYVLFNKRRVQ